MNEEANTKSKRYRPVLRSTVDPSTLYWLEKQGEPIGRTIDRLVAKEKGKRK